MHLDELVTRRRADVSFGFFHALSRKLDEARLPAERRLAWRGCSSGVAAVRVEPPALDVVGARDREHLVHEARFYMRIEHRKNEPVSARVAARHQMCVRDDHVVVYDVVE